MAARFPKKVSAAAVKIQQGVFAAAERIRKSAAVMAATAVKRQMPPDREVE